MLLLPTGLDLAQFPTLTALPFTMRLRLAVHEKTMISELSPDQATWPDLSGFPRRAKDRLYYFGVHLPRSEVLVALGGRTQQRRDAHGGEKLVGLMTTTSEGGGFGVSATREYKWW